VLVSEVMLQQTQTSRVVGPWERFLRRFPTPTSCADASLADVLRLWEGLGYHRRAKALHGAARTIRDELKGEVPSSVSELLRLPGVGEYTAHAVASFAFNERVAVLDTNVGRVLARAVANATLRPVAARTMASALLPRNDVAAFNQSMLDLGARFCKSSPLCDACPVARHCRWRQEGGPDPAPTSAGVSRPQPAFSGSNRQLRGRVLASLRHSPSTKRELDSLFSDVEPDRRDQILEGLVADGLIVRNRSSIQLAE
jgi:A/G-specific adenine glycosylase